MGDFSGFEYIIFDLDGVLLDTEPLYTRATQQIVEPYGKVFSWEVKATLMGRDARSSAQTLVDKLELPISADEYLALKEPLLTAMFPSASEIPGAAELVRRLHGARRKLAVATSSSSAHYALKTAQHAWFSLFEAVVCSDHPDVKQLKPAPDIFLVAAASLGARPEQCLVVEDSLAGVAAALAAGMQVLAFPAETMSDAAYAGARRIVRSYADLDWGD